MGAAEVIGVGMRDDNGLQLRLSLLEDAQGPAPSVAIETRVDQQSLPVMDHQPYVGAAL
jgi:hypothetical protein